MEWVETTGRTIEEALDAALDQLGVDEDDVEYEVLVEPRGGLFGRFGGAEARIRARVKPISREKPGERRRGRARRGPGGRPGGGTRPATESVEAATEETAAPRAEGAAKEPAGGGRRRSRGRGRGPGGGGAGAEAGAPARRDQKEQAVAEETVSIEEQAAAAKVFTQGLVDAFGVGGEVVTRVEDEDTVVLEVLGDDLGYLVGPKGATIQAIEELVRTVVQRRTEGHGVRITVDVAGYRARRRGALEAFTREQVAKVLESGRDLALEPMGAADRKVVHDTVAEIEGVTTISEGEEPRRRVVLRRA